MEELTIEEKAKAYDEALEKAKKLYEKGTITESLNYIFPELKESEDELTWLTKYIEEEAYNLSIDIRDDEDRIKLKKLQKALAWLGKQGKKPQDKSELDEIKFDDHLWKSADGDDLPEYDMDVIVLRQPTPFEREEFSIAFSHRPNPKGWDGLIAGKVEHFTPKTYGRGGWSIPDVVYWLDLEFPK